MRGPAGATVALVYADFECPYCAAAASQLNGARLCFSFLHFPLRSIHSWVGAAVSAAEAAAVQGRFWEMHDLLFADQGRLEDPHLWGRARTLGLDLEQFDADRRSEAVHRRVRRQFEAGVRGGIVTTPTLVVDGVIQSGRVDARTVEALSAPSRH